MFHFTLHGSWFNADSSFFHRGDPNLSPPRGSSFPSFSTNFAVVSSLSYQFYLFFSLFPSTSSLISLVEIGRKRGQQWPLVVKGWGRRGEKEEYVLKHEPWRKNERNKGRKDEELTFWKIENRQMTRLYHLLISALHLNLMATIYSYHSYI